MIFGRKRLELPTAATALPGRAHAIPTAEAYHQQHLAKNPHDYCGVGGTGVSCAIGPGVGA